jgi:hypothetical protein
MEILNRHQINQTNMNSRLREKIDHVWVGMVTGVLGAIVTFALFGIGFSLFNHCSFGSFFKDTFLGVQDFQSRIVTFSMLGNVILFFVFIRKDYNKFCKGLMAIMVLSVPVVVALY